jgi:protein gp37
MINTKIDWCDSTFNPITGCLHNCPYCYARGIARRFGGHWDEAALRNKGGGGTIHDLESPMYRHTTGKNRDRPAHDAVAPYPYGFDPTFHRYRLGEPAKVKKPQNIFVCSMADLFGDWVPDEWIQAVFAACEAAPQHRYLFLTKNRVRYCKFMDKYHTGINAPGGNYWFGWTQEDGKVGWSPTYKGYDIRDWNWFVSIEPIRGRIWNIEPCVKWVIAGGETGNRKGKIVPQREWIDDICRQADDRKIPVFMKDSLISIVGEENMRREFPW